MLDDTSCAAVEQKRDCDVASVCLVHMHDKMRQKRIDIPLDQPLLPGLRDYSIGKVVRFRGYDVPNAAARIMNVSGIARDHMKMKMGNGLPGCRSEIEANIKAVG